MGITKRDIMNQFDVNASAVEQEGSKQLFIVNNCNVTILVSYRTIIGIKHDGWCLTDEKFSPTTSKQTTQFINEYNGRKIAADAFKVLLTSYDLNQ